MVSRVADVLAELRVLNDPPVDAILAWLSGSVLSLGSLIQIPAFQIFGVLSEC